MKVQPKEVTAIELLLMHETRNRAMFKKLRGRITYLSWSVTFNIALLAVIYWLLA